MNRDARNHELKQNKTKTKTTKKQKTTKKTKYDVINQ